MIGLTGLFVAPYLVILGVILLGVTVVPWAARIGGGEIGARLGGLVVVAAIHLALAGWGCWALWCGAYLADPDATLPTRIFFFALGASPIGLLGTRSPQDIERVGFQPFSSLAYLLGLALGAALFLFSTSLVAGILVLSVAMAASFLARIDLLWDRHWVLDE